MKGNRYILASLISMLLSSPVFAGGFYIPEQGAKATGMGNAFAAIADDPSAVWFNPAGIAFQDKPALQLGSDLIAPQNDYTLNGTTYSAKKELFVVPHAYLVYGLGSDLTLGLAVNSPFGLATDWKKSNAPFSLTSAGASGVTFSQIEAMHLNANFAYKLNDSLALAAGGSYYDLRKVHLDSQMLNIGGHGNGWGGNAALLYKGDSFSAGLSYRSSVKTDINGTAVGGDGAGLLDPTLVGMAGNVSTSITLPDVASLAATFKAGSKLLLSVQADWVNWKTFDQIDLAFAPSGLNILTGSSSTIPEHWKSTMSYRLGLEWAQSEQSRIRAGYVIDPTPTNNQDLTPRLPGNDRTLITLGYGADLSEQMTVDIAYAYVKLKDRDLTTANTPIYNGSYASLTHLIAASLSYRF